MEKKPRTSAPPDEPTRKLDRKPPPRAPEIDERFLPTYDEDDGGNPAIDLLAAKIPDLPTLGR